MWFIEVRIDGKWQLLCAIASRWRAEQLREALINCGVTSRSYVGSYPKLEEKTE